MTKKHWLVLAGIVILGAALRFWGLSHIPPGLWFDEAWLAVQVRDLGVDGSYPLYFPADFGGLHPAIGYLTWVANQIVPSSLAVRYGVAGAAVVSLPLTFWGLRAIFELQDKTTANLLAQIGTFVLAITFPVLVLTRIGFETYLPALPACLAFGGIARAIQTHQKRYWVWVGLGMGAAPYTYIAGRVLPLALLVALVGLFLTRRLTRCDLGGVILAGTVAGTLLLPLTIYFGQHPELLTTRSGIASYNTLGAGADSVPVAILQNTIQTIAGISLPGFGDTQPRHNLPGRPIFDPFLSFLFWLGVAFSLAKLVKRGRRTVPILLLSWAGVMILPTVLSDGAPTFTRMLAGVPACAGICALGAQPILQRGHGLFLAVGLFASLSLTVYDYFGRWANDPRLYDAFQVAEWTVASAARAESEHGIVYLLPNLVNEANPTFDLQLRQTTVRSFDGANCFVYRDTAPQPILYLVDLRTDALIMEKLGTLYPTGRVEEPILHAQLGYPMFSVFRVPALSPTTPPPQSLSAQFGEIISLWGFTVDPYSANAGEIVVVTLYWQSEGKVPANYTVLLHAYPTGNSEATPIAQADAQPCAGDYPTSQWTPGEIILDRHQLFIPSDWNGESLILAIGWYELASGMRLPLPQTDASLPNNRLHLFTLATPP